MKNHIYCVPRFRFQEEMKAMTEQQFMSGAFISIHDPAFGKILSDGPNVLNLWFHDAEPEKQNEIFEFAQNWVDENETIYFDEDMAAQVFDFVQRNKNAKFFLIHCTAGKCRSGAVGEVLSEYFGINYFDFKRDSPQISPNIFVKKILKKIFGDTQQNI